MYLYEVWVASARYHKPEALLYGSREQLAAGTVVEVMLQQRKAIGFIAKRANSKPTFVVKDILRIIPSAVLPPAITALQAWLQTYYPAPSGLITQLFLPPAFLQHISTATPASLPTSKPTLPPLTAEQQEVLTKLQKQSGAVLLHGDTGTGKTRIYLELAQQAISQNTSALVLTPEIGLTPQLAKTFRGVFGDRVLITHSHLTDAQRRNIWLQLSGSNEPYVVIGPRSALFLPIKKLGIVVLDEAHDASYKQEQSPQYQATRVAAKLAQLHHCLCIFGSATPLVADYYALTRRKVPVLRMTKSVNPDIRQPAITIVERAKKEAFSRSWLFSDKLLDAIQKTYSAHKTSLIFLNRRGTARLVICNQCSWHAECPNCDVSLTYHQDAHLLRCHICNHQTTLPLECPDCSSTDIVLRSAGTKGLQTELERFFPEARFARFDSDTSTAQSLEKQYQQIHTGNVDIIIGTQMIAKGLDLPSLGLVGIPFADTSLYIPDFTADEQTYQLLTQVMGRVGRTNHPTQIVIQTFNAKQPALQAATRKNWNDFYNNQLKERRRYAYPPFYYLLQLSYVAKRESTAKKAGITLVQTISTTWPNATVLGPSPHFHHRTKNTYHWQVIVKATDRALLLEIVKHLPSGWRHNLDPTNLL